jgi:hypothetical protein
MRQSEVKQALDLLVQTKQPCFLWGAPGIGKSAMVRACAESNNLELIDIRAVLLDPVDLRGLPHVNGDNRAHWCIPEFLPREGNGILFLDELNAAPQLVQAACYQLILDRKLGEYTMPDDWSIIAAGNRETDRAVTSRMPSALANRFVHIDCTASIDDWIAWALNSSIAIEVIAFLRFRPALLHSFDPAKNEKAFPTPRSWEFISNIMQANPDDSIKFELFTGTIGEGAAAEFLGFLKIWQSLPNPDAILMNPSSMAVPDDPATLYALTGALVRKASDVNIDNLMQYAGRMPAEFSVLLVKDMLRLKPALANTKAFINWSVSNQGVLV